MLPIFQFHYNKSEIVFTTKQMGDVNTEVGCTLGNANLAISQCPEVTPALRMAPPDLKAKKNPGLSVLSL